MRRLPVAFLLVACGGKPAALPDAGADAAPPPIDAALPTQLDLSFSRDPAAGGPFEIDLAVTRGGVAVSGVGVIVTSPDAAIGPAREVAAGHYRADVTPRQPSGLVRVHATALGGDVDRTAVLLPHIDPAWGQPELVPGLVNTPGYEDSAEVSPDGEWLIVSDYSPVDLICCLLATCTAPPGTPSDPAAPACNVSLGPYAAPARPRLPGAERILSPTVIHDTLPPLGIDLPLGTDFARALPPLAGYGFHRQPDGSFAEPFVIAFAADGATVTPFGITFARPIAGDQATVLFAYDDLRNSGGAYGPRTGNDLYHDTLTLGRDNNLGTYSIDAKGIPVTDRFPTLVPLPDRAGPQGNPSVSSDGVWFDTEQGAEDLFFAAGDPLGTAPLAAPVKVALSRADRVETQPYVHGDLLYFAADQREIRTSRRAPGGAPDAAATWSAERVELGFDPGAPAVGAVAAIGEPSIELRGGVETLYFVVAIKTATGLDLGVARVRHAP
jgi:hypothetical protein